MTSRQPPSRPSLAGDLGGDREQPAEQRAVVLGQVGRRGDVRDAGSRGRGSGPAGRCRGTRTRGRPRGPCRRDLARGDAAEQAVVGHAAAPVASMGRAVAASLRGAGSIAQDLADDAVRGVAVDGVRRTVTIAFSRSTGSPGRGVDADEDVVLRVARPIGRRRAASPRGPGSPSRGRRRANAARAPRPSPSSSAARAFFVRLGDLARHPGRRRPGPRRVAEDVEAGEVERPDERERSGRRPRRPRSGSRRSRRRGRRRRGWPRVPARRPRA